MAQIFQIGDDRSGSIQEWLKARHPELLEQAVAARVDGKLLDLSAPLPDAERLEIITFEDEAGQEVFRHTASHIMAEAVQELFPDADLAIGPAIEDGFYYDFDLSKTFEPEDLAKIEAKMSEIIQRDLPLQRAEVALRGPRSVRREGREVQAGIDRGPRRRNPHRVLAG